MSDTRLVADDLFAGAGGWDVAADWLDVHARGVENMPAARATRDAAGLTTIHDDVWTFKPRYRMVRDRVQLIASGQIASPPCQPFSTAGKGAGRKALTKVLQLIPHVGGYSLKQLRRIGMRATGDERTALVLTPLWFALHHPYRWLAWEQVPGVLPVWEACAVVLRAAGFSVVTGVLSAEQYGVPQTRKRAVLIASRDLEVSMPTPTHSRYYVNTPERLDDGVAKWVSMADALGASVRGRIIQMNAQLNATQRRAEHPAPTVIAGHATGDMRWLAPAGSSSQVVDPRPTTHPAATITGAGNAEWCTRPRRAKGPRLRDPNAVRVTVQEAGVLQGFPADFPWQGPQTKQYLQCGNAVPPPLAMAVLSAALGEPYVPPILTATEQPAQPALAY